MSLYVKEFPTERTVTLHHVYAKGNAANGTTAHSITINVDTISETAVGSNILRVDCTQGDGSAFVPLCGDHGAQLLHAYWRVATGEESTVEEAIDQVRDDVVFMGGLAFASLDDITAITASAIVIGS